MIECSEYYTFEGGEQNGKNNLSTLLGTKRIRISDVARDTKISRTTLTALYYDKGEAVSFRVLETLCNYLNCEVGDILTVTGAER